MTGECFLVLAKLNCLGCWIESTPTCFLTSTHHAWDVLRCASRSLLTTSNCIQHFFGTKLVNLQISWQSFLSMTCQLAGGGFVGHLPLRDLWYWQWQWRPCWVGRRCSWFQERRWRLSNRQDSEIKKTVPFGRRCKHQLWGLQQKSPQFSGNLHF